VTDNTSISIDDLKPKQKLTGIVKKVELVGAVVDIGVGRDGLVHISQLKEGRVNNVSDVVSEGQEVTVWVRRVDKKSGRIDLTMLEPPDVAWDELQVGQTVKGKVVRLEKFGAFIDVGAERPGLVHVSELADGYVKSPSDVVGVGDEIEAKVIGLSRKKGRIDLSIKALGPTLSVEEAVGEEEPLTAFALAYQRALMEEEQQEAAEDEGSSQVASDRRRRMQDELLERTLEQHKSRE
jgi:small subunit ribosomal protein S1